MEGVRLRRIGAILRADVLPTLVIGTAIIVGGYKAAEDQVPPYRALDAASYTLFALSVATIPLRRHAPLVMLGISSLIVGSYLAAGYPRGPITFSLIVAAYMVGATHPLRRAATAVVPAAILFAVAADIGERRALVGSGNWLDWLTAAGMTGFVLVPALIGTLAQRTRVYHEQAKEEATRRKVEQERLRVAREVHDVVGHSLSIISLQAGVALHVLDRRPEQAQVALEAIRRTSRDALDELRATLALTRAGTRAAGPDTGQAAAVPAAWSAGRSPAGDAAHDDADAGTRSTDGHGHDHDHDHDGPCPAAAARVPLTGLARLDGLLGEVRLCGVPVDLVMTGRPGDLPSEVDLAAYRVIQESLTNVMRHAAPARARVRLGYEPDRFVVEVVDEPSQPAAPPPGARCSGLPPGHGLAGLSERLGELGGSLAAGPWTSGGLESSCTETSCTETSSPAQAGNGSRAAGTSAAAGTSGWRVHAVLPVPKAGK